MSNSKATVDKVVNYTPEMIKILQDNAPYDMAKAKAVGILVDRSWRSVVAKAKSLELEYIAKPTPAKKPKGETKLDIVADICALCSLESLTGLEKAPATALRALRAAIPIVEDASES